MGLQWINPSGNNSLPNSKVVGLVFVNFVYQKTSSKRHSIPDAQRWAYSNLQVFMIKLMHFYTIFNTLCLGAK